MNWLKRWLLSEHSWRWAFRHFPEQPERWELVHLAPLLAAMKNCLVCERPQSDDDTRNWPIIERSRVFPRKRLDCSRLQRLEEYSDLTNYFGHRNLTSKIRSLIDASRNTVASRRRRLPWGLTESTKTRVNLTRLTPVVVDATGMPTPLGRQWIR